MDRDAPSQVKALQARWQEQAKALALAQRDERVLWEQFRAACDAVFTARDAKRKEEDGRKHESRRALDDLCAEMEKLAAAADKSDQDLKRQARELQDQWKKLAGKFDPALQGVESRFKHAPDGGRRNADRAHTLARGGRLADAGREGAPVRATRQPRARRCAARTNRQWAHRRHTNSGWRCPHCRRRGNRKWRPAAMPRWKRWPRRKHRRHIAIAVESGAAARSDALLELEMALGLDSPAEFQAQRLALQVRQLRDRFQSSGTASAASPADRLVAWCATPGVADTRDRARVQRVFSAVEKLR